MPLTVQTLFNQIDLTSAFPDTCKTALWDYPYSDQVLMGTHTTIYVSKIDIYCPDWSDTFSLILDSYLYRFLWDSICFFQQGLRWIALESVVSLIFYIYFFSMQIDVNTLTYKNLQLLNINFYYKCSYDQGCLILHLAKIDKVVQNL